ncbi:unnamed protein product [Orchesella dallaii]|uniref:Uncharacterized protein n=1 Tax=Orchesella dallaii TaxID=48710 RepID=A0ABP1QLE8_9HEXA
MFGTPGSLTMYSTANRGGMLTTDGIPCGPADYHVITGSIKQRNETVAPFDTSAERNTYKFTFMPGPAAYFPDKPQRESRGAPIMLPDHFPAGFKRGFRSTGPGPCYKLMDQFTKMTQDAKLMATKKPRVSFEKFVSNCVPSIYHPQDIRCFVPGLDGRMYPWRIDRHNKSPGPKYNTSGIQTSKSKKNPPTDFSRCSKRPPLFKTEAGFSPADFTIPRSLDTRGGIMLGQTSDPRSSDLRYFDRLERRAKKEHIPRPSEYAIPSEFDKESPKAVSAPFKSKTKLGIFKPVPGPGPAGPSVKRKIRCLDLKLIPVFNATTPPASFNSSEPRFFTLENNEQESRPPPCAYTITGFAEQLQNNVEKHRPAFKNPKMGFLVSSEQRPDWVFKNFFNRGEFAYSISSPRRPWKNMRPKRGATFTYHGQPPKYPNSPGPIYDSNPGTKAIKAKKTWNDPRRWIYNTAFLVSGCSRNITLGHIDKDIPGPGKYYPKFSDTYGGKLSCGKSRFPKSESVGPGPSHKLHEKADSSLWRASHLGTFNSKLKQIGQSYPNSGGFHAKVLDKAADKAWRIERKDEYGEILAKPLQSKCMSHILKVQPLK